MIEHFQSFLKLRPRSSWEACDSGILIWRNSIAYILLFMGIPFLCCVVLLAFLNSYIQFFSVLIIWWLKPFFDRCILQVISVRFFRNDAAYKTIRKGFLKNIFNGLIGDLTWKRFSLYRSARLPVRILEGNKRKLIRRRIQNLKNGGLDFCALLTCVCSMLEIVLFGIFAFFLYSFFTEFSDFTFDLISDYMPQVSLACLFLTSITILIVEPLYVCMGFGIYINSRSIVEGWDIELGFNSFIREKKTTSLNVKMMHPKKFIPLIVSILLLSNIYQPMHVQAEEWYQNNSDDVPAEILDEIFSSEDFGSLHTRKWFRFKEMNSDNNSSRIRFDDLNFKNILGFILRALLVLIIAAAVLFAVYRLFKMKGQRFSNKTVPWQKKTIPGFANQENPDSLADTAKKYFAEGQIRKAWAACLSAVLGLYADKGNITFTLNDTESDCLVKINRSALWGKEESAELILHWIKLAYAGIEPEAEQFYEAVSFFSELKKKLFISGDTNE